MEDDIVDFEDFDYGDLGDINPDDLDIENLERELGLLNEEASSDVPKSDTVTQVEPEIAKKPEDDKKAVASKPDEPTTTTQSKEEERPMNAVNKQSGIKSTYTSSGSPRRTPFVPHSAASFPQYPFAHQGMMGMNMMMSQMQMPFPGMPMMMGYPPRPMGNKIHINPKFAAMQQNRLQQQQQQQQPSTNSVTQEEIDRQRQQLLEMQRKRQAGKSANAARSPPKASEPTQQPTAPKRKLTEEEDTREQKRPFTIKGLSKGITIKGAAAAAESSTRKPPSGILDRISSPFQKSSPKPILDRISSPGSPANAAVMSHLNGSRKRESPDQSSSLERPTKKSTTPIPITTKGTTSTLVIKNLSETTTQADLVDLSKSGPKDLVSLNFDKTKLQATMTYKTSESAVIMRRQYNRTSFKGSHIVISFS